MSPRKPVDAEEMQRRMKRLEAVYIDQRNPPVILKGEPPPHVQAFNETPEVKRLREAWELHEKTMLLSDNDRPMADKAFEQVRGRRSKLK